MCACRCGCGDGGVLRVALRPPQCASAWGNVRSGRKWRLADCCRMVRAVRATPCGAGLSLPERLCKALDPVQAHSLGSRRGSDGLTGTAYARGRGCMVLMLRDKAAFRGAGRCSINYRCDGRLTCSAFNRVPSLHRQPTFNSFAVGGGALILACL